MDTPVKRYSTGMLSRLSFAIAMQFPADIYIFDEVLAVVDGEFQARCLNAIRGLRRGGRTVIFVSHSLRQVADLLRTSDVARRWAAGARRSDWRGARRRHRGALRPLAMASPSSPTVSVTIVLHNSERELGRCLAAIRPDVVRGFAELIAVDNASPDDSAGAVGRARCRLPGSSVRLKTSASRRGRSSRGLTSAVDTGCS